MSRTSVGQPGPGILGRHDPQPVGGKQEMVACQVLTVILGGSWAVFTHRLFRAEMVQTPGSGGLLPEAE